MICLIFSEFIGLSFYDDSNLLRIVSKKGRLLVKTPVNPLLQWLNMFLVAVHYPELMDGRYMLTVVLIQSTKVWQNYCVHMPP